MDEQELDEQFEATDYDEKGNILLPPPPIAAPKKKRITVAEINKHIDQIENYIDSEILDWLGGLDVRVDRLETTTSQHNDTLLKDVKSRIENQDAAIGALADAVRDLIEKPATPEPEPEPELVFAQPPPQPAGGQTSKRDLEAVASVCNSMTDVLMICRALKAAPDLTDEDRNYILQVAGRAAGVPLTGGIYIRAGVRNVEA